MLPNPYGMAVTLDNAKRAAAPALAEARENNWTMAVAIVDAAGDLVYFEKMDATQTGSVAVSIAKARSAALFKRPTKAFQDALAAGGDGLRILKLECAARDGRQDRRRDRPVGRHQSAGRSVRAGRRERAEVIGRGKTRLTILILVGATLLNASCRKERAARANTDGRLAHARVVVRPRRVWRDRERHRRGARRRDLPPRAGHGGQDPDGARSGAPDARGADGKRVSARSSRSSFALMLA
jgi:hypothetical protein